jgi:hypothetical protein
VDRVERAGRHRHAVAQQPGGGAQCERVEARQQRAEEGGRPVPRRTQPFAEQGREFLGAPAEPGDGERVLAGHFDGDGVVAGPHVGDEGERDPLGLPARHDEQRVFEDVQLDRGSRDCCAEPSRVTERADLRRCDLGPRVPQLREQLSPHPAEPAELERAPVREQDEDGERLGLRH